MISFFRSLFDRKTHWRSVLEKHPLARDQERLAASTLLNFQRLAQVCPYGFDRAVMSLHSVQVCHVDVKDLISFLQKINVPLSNVEALLGSDCPSTTHAKSLKDFFVDSSGCYIAVEPAVKELITHATETCEYLHNWEHCEPGTERHNARVLQRVLYSLADISDALLQCSVLRST